MSREDESRLIARALCGHAESFRAIVDAYKDRLFAFVFRVVRNHHEAEDVCQSAFVKAYESLKSYSSQYAFSTWLFTIAYRLCLNAMRKKRAVATDFELIGAGPVSEEDAPSVVAGSEEARRLRDLIWTAVDELTPQQRSAVMLFYREGKSCQEIGLILDMPPVTVKSHLHRAREKLRTMLSGALVDDWMAIHPRTGSDSA